MNIGRLGSPAIGKQLFEPLKISNEKNVKKGKKPIGGMLFAGFRKATAKGKKIEGERGEGRGATCARSYVGALCASQRCV